MQRRDLLAIAWLPLLASCDFQLRGASQLSFQRIALVGFAPRSPLADELRRTLAQSAQVVADPHQSELVLEALKDVREKSVVASTAAGQVREVQLRSRLVFRLSTRAGKPVLEADEILRTSDMSYNETAALAKEQEEATLYRAMESDIVSQLMRRLEAVKTF
jgi:LPS-assembly lipoprotein